jgi:hypothetical protein
VARPPERSKTAPVVKEFSADTIQATMAAISSTDEAAARDLGQHVVDVLLGHLLEDPGARRGRGDAVDGDVVAGEFLAERLGERDDAGLGGRIGRGVGVALLAGDRGDVDDAAVIARLHAGITARLA